MSSSAKISEYNQRISQLQSKLSDEVDRTKKQRINYDIEILRLRIRISMIQNNKQQLTK
jgi:hypothetical protein